MISRCGAVAILALGPLAAACGDGTEGVVLGLAAPPADDAGEIGDGPITDASAPATIALGTNDTTPLHGGTSGTPQIETCPGDQALVGFTGDLTLADATGATLVGAVQGVCGVLHVEGDHVAVAGGATLTTWGTTRDLAWSATCPADAVVVGISGRSGGALDALSPMCAPWSLVGGDGGSMLTQGAMLTQAANGGDGGSPFDAPCPSGEIARGVDLRWGQWIDAFGLVCARPTLH